MNKEILKNYFKERLENGVFEGPAIALNYPLQRTNHTNEIVKENLIIYDLSKDNRPHIDLKFINYANNSRLSKFYF